MIGGLACVLIAASVAVSVAIGRYRARRRARFGDLLPFTKRPRL